MSGFARVAFESPLPQLDKLFDYAIPDGLSVTPGVRVRVPFGRNKKLLDGFVVEVNEQANFSGKLQEIAAVISPIPALPEDIYQLCRAVADRQAVSLGDVLRLAVPKRAVRVEEAFLKNSLPSRENSTLEGLRLDFAAKPLSFDGRLAMLAEPRNVEAQFVGSSVAANKTIKLSGWIAIFIAASIEAISHGRSSICVVPDFRDRERLLDALAELALGEYVVDYGADRTPSQRYQAFLNASSGPRVVVGSRSAAYAQVRNLGQLLLWDDQDQSLEEPTTPYLHAREVLLLRQQQSGSRLLFCGHSRSPEIERLVQMGYLLESSSNFAKPKIALSDGQWRIDSAGHRLVAETTTSGGSVLIQVASPGQSTALFCAECSLQYRCGSCGGPIATGPGRNYQCRWCNAQKTELRCPDCSSLKVRQGRPGSERTVAELGRMFPGVNIIEATFEKRILKLPAGKRIVVATPGAEPSVEGGYAAVLFLDVNVMMSRDSLRSAEQAINVWSNAVAQLGLEGRALLSGQPSPLLKMFALWDHRAIASNLLTERAALGLPPVKRLGSATGEPNLIRKLESFLCSKADLDGRLRILGPSSLNLTDSRILLEFDYSIGSILADYLSVFVLENSTGLVRTSPNGRSSRALKIRMDDYEVI